MNVGEILVPLGVFTMITVSVGLLTRLVATGMLNRTIREAIRAGHPGMVMFLAQKLEARQPWADALLGWIAIALAVALVGLGLFDGDEDRLIAFKAAFVAAVIGVTVLLYARMAKPTEPMAPPAPPPPPEVS